MGMENMCHFSWWLPWKYPIVVAFWLVSLQYCISQFPNQCFHFRYEFSCSGKARKFLLIENVFCFCALLYFKDDKNSKKWKSCVVSRFSQQFCTPLDMWYCMAFIFFIRIYFSSPFIFYNFIEFSIDKQTTLTLQMK